MSSQQESTPNSVKLCGRCGGERHHTGSRWRCSRCFNAWQAAHRAGMSVERRAAVRTEENANARARKRAWSPEQRASQNARVQAWRDADPERHRKGARDWYWRNAERARAAKLAEYYREPEKFYARNLMRKARILDAVCVHGARCVDAAFLAELYRSRCLYCGAAATAADHFVSLARAGLHCRENLVPACASCNAAKYTTDPAVWLERKVWTHI